MSSMGNGKSVLFLAAALSLAAATPSFALSVINPAYADQVTGEDATNTSVSAFSNGAATKGSGSVVLTAEEIQHIRSCAERYMSYHASDNTYAGPSGARLECRSK